MANFVMKLKRGIGKYKGKNPLKCFKCGKIGHFVMKCPLKNNSEYDSNQRRESNRKRYSKKKIFFAKIGNDSSEYDKEESNDGKNEIVFMAFESNDNQEEENEEAVVDLEAKILQHQKKLKA